MGAVKLKQPIFYQTDINSFEKFVEDLYEEFFDKCIHFIHGYFRKRKDIKKFDEDIIHELFVQISVSSDRYLEIYSHSGYKGLRNYILTNLKNRCNDKFRENKIETFLDEVPFENSNPNLKDVGKGSYENIELREDVVKAINKLGPYQRKVLELELEGWSNKKIAEELNKSEQSISNVRRRAIKKLKKKFGDQ